MRDDQPVTFDEAEHFGRQVLLAIAHSAGGGPVEQLDIASALQTSPEAVAHAVQILADDGLIRILTAERHLGQSEDDADVQLTGSGRRQVQTWESFAARPSRVRSIGRAAVLQWLDDQDGRRPSSAMEITALPEGHVYGRPLTESEIEAASNDLFERGLINAKAAWGTGHVMRPTITGRGADLVVRADGDLGVLARYIAGGEEGADTGSMRITVTNSPGANIAAHSPGASQSSHVTIDLAGHLDHVLRDLSDLRNSLDPQEQGRADRVIEGLTVQREAERPDPRRLERLLNDARQIWIGAMGTVGGAGALKVIEETGGLLEKFPL